MVNWVSPTGHNDPSGDWSNETNAYDDDTATYADADISFLTSSGWLELTHLGVEGDKVRYYVERLNTDISIDALEIRYDGTWHDHTPSSEEVNWGGWTEITIGSEVTMTGIRIKFYNVNTTTQPARWCEADFGGTPLNSPPNAPTNPVPADGATI